MNIEKFNPTKAELLELKTKYESLEIQDENDTAGYALVDTARKDLKSKRVEIKKVAKEMRNEAIDFQKNVIGLEKKLISIIEPLEKELQTKQMLVDNIQALPMRKEECDDYDVIVEDSLLLKMSTIEYKKFISQAKETHYKQLIAEKEIYYAQLTAEKEQKEAQKRAKEEKIQIEKEARAKAKQEVEEERLRREQAKEQKRKAEREQIAKAEQDEKVKQWKVQNNFNVNTDFVQVTGDKMILFRRVSEIIL